jgi:hypothetical protein
MLLGVTGLSLFAVVGHRYLLNAICSQFFYIYVPGTLDRPTQSLHQITLQQDNQISTWQLNWAMCLCFRGQDPQWIFTDEVNPETFASLRRLEKVTHGKPGARNLKQKLVSQKL